MVTGRLGETGPLPGGLEHLVDTVGGDRLAPARSLEREEHPVRRHARRSFAAEVVTDRGEERVRDRDHPLMAALALGDEQRTVRHPDVLEPQPEDLAAPQPAQQHRQDHRPVPVRPQRVEERPDLLRGEDPRQRPGHPDQGHMPAAAAEAAVHQPARHRVRLHTSVTPGDEIRVEPRHRGEPPGDRPGREPRLPIGDPDHRPIPALLGHELEDIHRGHLRRRLATTTKKVFRSCAVARNVFGRDRPATNAR